MAIVSVCVCQAWFAAIGDEHKALTQGIWADLYTSVVLGTDGKQGSTQQEQELWYTKQVIGMLVLEAIAP